MLQVNVLYTYMLLVTMLIYTVCSLDDFVTTCFSGKYLEFMPYNCAAWQAFAQLEVNVGEMTRARWERDGSLGLYSTT